MQTLPDLKTLSHTEKAPVSYESINANIYDYCGSKNAMKLLVNSLRNKIQKESIVNVSGFGYKLNLRHEN